MRKQLLATFGGAAVVATAGLSAAVPAMAATAAPAAHHVPLTGVYKLCLANDSTECAKSEGSSPMQTYVSGYSTWNPTILSNGDVIFVNGSGNCAHGNTSNFVVTSSSCGSGNTASQWKEVTVSGHLAFQNVAYGGIMYSAGDGNGSDVVLAPQGTPGDWVVSNFSS